ncbi:MAG: permease [Candidatus Omnitrophica bacterium]|nr:permease [Candidatus Omnitrophota bacterium]
MKHDCCDSKDQKLSASNVLKSKTSVIFIVCFILWGASSQIPALKHFAHSMQGYFSKIWWTVGLGLLIGGVIDQLVPKNIISYFLSGTRKRVILHAVGFGMLMSVCSHGVLAIAVQIHKKGASTAAVVAFLLAAPWVNLPLILLMFGLFGSKVFILVAGAVLTALWTGYIFQALESRGWIEPGLSDPENFSRDPGIIKEWMQSFRKFSLNRTNALPQIKSVLKSAFLLSDMIVLWVAVGIVAASATGAFIPHEYVGKYLGSDFAGLLRTLGIATVVEVCSEGTAPIAFELYQKTGALGNAFVFLMAGVVTDYTEIGLLWQNIGRKCAMMLPIVSVPPVILMAYLLN